MHAQSQAITARGVRPCFEKNYLVRTRVFSAHSEGPHRSGRARRPGASLGAQRGPAGAASARPPARSGGVEARAAQPALQRELSAALGSLCSQPQQRRLRHSAETETSGGDARTGSYRRAAELPGTLARRPGRFRGPGGLEDGQPERRRPRPDTHTAPKPGYGRGDSGSEPLSETDAEAGPRR
ncbi:hypothetical protein HPG69_000190 [Diceros bicornis minor]|uniref:Uncharacterized protein n=1 Tax=Diceros bicornis minor TaxID=77932 RepID=A0A7J7EUU8_DICBM|nr:hypothetical protein HPG69_000190 [Diceros bicornis minor]